jgi:hypothetical protein
MSPKYRHRGYMDSDSRDERDNRGSQRSHQQLTMEEKIQRRSIRKATDRNANEVVRCHSCGRNVQDYAPITAQSVCPNCSVPLRCCRACTHFDSAARWQCRAEIEKAVGDKNAVNACTQYSPRLVLDFTGRRSSGNGNGGGGRRRSNDPRSQFEDLFRR